MFDVIFTIARYGQPKNIIDVRQIMSGSYSIFTDVQTGCGGCRKMFGSRIPLAINIKTDPQLLNELRSMELLMSTCTHCGHKATSPILFIYHDPDVQRFWFVIPEYLDTRYQLVRNVLEGYAEKYAQQFPPEERKAITSLTPSILPLVAFLLKIESPQVSGTGNGFIHFTPFPKIDLPENNSVKLDDQHFQNSIEPFSVALVEGNHPKFFDTLWKLTQTEFQQGSARSYLGSDKIAAERRPIATFGIAEVLFYVGSSIVVPIFVGVLTNLLTSLVTQKKKASEELETELERAKQQQDPREELISLRVKALLEAQDHPMTARDLVRIKIRIKESLTEYTFSGTFHEVLKQLRQFRKDALDSVRIPSDCHIANFVGDMFMDVTLPNDSVGSMTEIAARYERVFSNETRVRFGEGKAGELMHESVELCAKARAFMENQDYEQAVMVLQQGLRGEDTSVELLYNYAICLHELGEHDAGQFFFEQVLIRSINLPPLKESKDFVLGHLGSTRAGDDSTSNDR